MRIVYVGPSSTGVDIAETGQHAEPGTPIDVDDVLGASLLEQDIWQPEDARPVSPAAEEED